MDKKLLKRAIKKAGNQSKLASMLGCSRQFISMVVKGIKKMPERYILEIDNILKDTP